MTVDENHPMLRFRWFVCQDIYVSIESIIRISYLVWTVKEELEYLSRRVMVMEKDLKMV